jgi:hypothetical protein
MSIQASQYLRWASSQDSGEKAFESVIRGASCLWAASRGPFSPGAFQSSGTYASIIFVQCNKNACRVAGVGYGQLQERIARGFSAATRPVRPARFVLRQF